MSTTPEAFSRYVSDQNSDAYLEPIAGYGLTVELAYMRSYESRMADEPGQDYYEVRLGGSAEQKPQVAFVVCDGVGGSFMGNKAAKLIGEKLAETLWDWDISFDDIDQCRHIIEGHLRRWMDAIQTQIHQQPIEQTLPTLLQSALHRQRNYGSETMFVCGLIRGEQLLWMSLGDVRLKLLTRDRQLAPEFPQTLDTSRRWSSTQGIRGDLEVGVFELAQVAHIFAFTDGLSAVEDRIGDMPLGIKCEIEAIANAPDSDDIAYVHIELGKYGRDNS